jgi:hypothetical protein
MHNAEHLTEEMWCMARARRRRAVCQVGDLFGLNTGRGPAAARVGVHHGCGSASRSVLGVTCRYCESPTRI